MYMYVCKVFKCITNYNSFFFHKSKMGFDTKIFFHKTRKEFEIFYSLYAVIMTKMFKKKNNKNKNPYKMHINHHENVIKILKKNNNNKNMN